MTEVDKEIILLGIPHSQNKFDALEEYQKRGESTLNEYVEALTKEVKDHLEKEKGSKVNDDDAVMVFIKEKVQNTIQTQLAMLNIVK